MAKTTEKKPAAKAATKKTDADVKGEASKKKAAPVPAAAKKTEAKPAPAAAKATPPPAKKPEPTAAPTTSGAIAGPGSAAVLDKPEVPRFKTNPPRNPFQGTKNPRLRDRD